VKIFLFVFFMLFTVAGQVRAQMMDMRAFSRQRGFKAYQAPVSAVKTETARSRAPRQYEEQNIQPNALPLPEQNMAAENQEKQETSPIRQKGFRIFQEKDEKKVMNFDVENPEFKKLNQQRQQDVLNRITFEKN